MKSAPVWRLFVTLLKCEFTAKCVHQNAVNFNRRSINHNKEVCGGRHSSVDQSAPTILWSRVQFPSTFTSMLFANLYLNCYWGKGENNFFNILPKVVQFWFLGLVIHLNILQPKTLRYSFFQAFWSVAKNLNQSNFLKK